MKPLKKQPSTQVVFPDGFEESIRQYMLNWSKESEEFIDINKELFALESVVANSKIVDDASYAGGIKLVDRLEAILEEADALRKGTFTSRILEAKNIVDSFFADIKKDAKRYKETQENKNSKYFRERQKKLNEEQAAADLAAKQKAELLQLEAEKKAGKEKSSAENWREKANKETDPMKKIKYLLLANQADARAKLKEKQAKGIDVEPEVIDTGPMKIKTENGTITVKPVYIGEVTFPVLFVQWIVLKSKAFDLIKEFNYSEIKKYIKQHRLSDKSKIPGLKIKLEEGKRRGK